MSSPKNMNSISRGDSSVSSNHGKEGIPCIEATFSKHFTALSCGFIVLASSERSTHVPPCNARIQFSAASHNDCK